MSARRLIPLIAAVCAITGPLALPSQGGASTLPIPGTYTLHFKWHGSSGYSKARIVLRANHTGYAKDSADPRVPITWSQSGRVVTWTGTFGKVTATYVGPRTAKGFGSIAKPGHMSNTKHQHGVWYASSVTSG